MIFQDDIRKFVNSGKFGKEVCDDFLQLLESGEFIRDEGAKKNYSVFFYEEVMNVVSVSFSFVV